MPRILRAFVILALSLPATLLAAPAESADTVLQRFADSLKTFEAHFDQVQTDDRGKVTGRSSGHFWLSRPDRFRWSYEHPYQQLTVCDGRQLWSYDPDLEQVTVRAAGTALHGTPAELLARKTALNDAFTVQDGGLQGTWHRVRLVPKNAESDFKSIELDLDADGVPQRMRFADQIGGHSDIEFTEPHANIAIDAQQFQFTPPAGVEVVHADADIDAPQAKTPSRKSTETPQSN